MPDSSSKSGSARQPSSRPPFQDWLGIRFSSWNAGFQLEKRIPKTTFITAPFQEGLARDPLFELDCRIPARKADPQDNLRHGLLSGGIGWGSAFRAGMPDSSWKSGSPRQPSSRPPFRRDWLGIRFSSWNAGFQLEKRIPKTTFVTAPFQEGLAGIRFSSWNAGFQLEKRFITAPFSGGIGWGSAFRAGMPDSSSRQPSSRPPFQKDWPGIRFSFRAGMPDSSSKIKTTFITAPFSGGIGWGSAFRAGMPDSSSKSGSPRQPSSRPPFQEGLAGDPLFELECRIPRQPSSRPPFRRDWLGIRFSSWNAGFQLEKRIPKTTFITAPFSGGIGRGSAFRAGFPDSSSKSGSPRQPSSRPPFRRDWLGIRFSSCNAGFEKRIPKTTFITAPFSGLVGDPLFELECRIPARKADPQDNLHHGPLFRRDWPGIRFSSWISGFQLEKRIPKTTFITAPFQEGLAGDPLFEL